MTFARRPFLALAALTLALAVASPSAFAADTVRGTGVAATDRRDVGAFVGVAVGGSIAVVLRQGNREAIEIVADDNVLPLIETEVRGSGDERTLQIDFVKNARVEPRTPIVVTVDFVRLERLALGGSGSIDGKAIKTAKLKAAIGGSGSIGLGGIDVGDLAVSIGGSGSFRADGQARNLAVNIGGSGHCDAERLTASDVTVAMAGSGDARVHADSALKATIAGSGDVYYSGAATPHVAIVGSGRVKKL
ncbi:MAG TPA: head GIN domain-containing protein [Caldimonas sp.]|jgi:hypothetical protein|nr:head GIN domain-containing protein [Caldimonas sp.]HEX4236157.1 head GIN domain-containing protein [Caldimonas sp.]